MNTALAVIAGALVSNVGGSTNPAWLVAIAAAGITLSYTWHRGIHSYRDINTAKFNIIHQIESRLPLRLYHAEWLALGEGRDPKRFLPFTSVERKVPWVFIAIYVSAVLIAIAEHTALLSARAVQFWA